MGFLDDSQEEVKKEEEEKEEVEKIKLGDTEFDPDELEDIVGKYKEWDEKTKNYGGVDKLVSDYGYRANKIGQLESKLSEYEEKAKAAEVPQGQVSQQDIMKAAAEQGLITKENLNDYLTQYRAAEKLVDEVKAYETKGNPYEAKELPAFNSAEMLDYMSQTGIKNPKAAYNVRYEAEIDAWKQKQLHSGRPSGMVTQESAPGNKQPKPVKITRDNLSTMVSAALNREI